MVRKTQVRIALILSPAKVADYAFLEGDCPQVVVADVAERDGDCTLDAECAGCDAQCSFHLSNLPGNRFKS